MPNKQNISNKGNAESHLTGFTDDNVHIMPQMFYEKSRRKKGGKFWTIILISLVVLVLTAIIILVFFLLTQNSSQTNSQANATQNANNTKVVLDQTTPKTTAPTADLKTTNTTTNTTGTTTNTVNTNTNANTNPTANTTPSLSETKVPSNKELTKGLDTDKDNLSDVEEGIYGTSITKPDTDGDGFLDGEEVKSLYDPLIAGALLEAGDSAVKYENPSFKYTILYPKEWAARSLDQSNREVIFSSATGDFIEVLVEDNPQLETAKTWYLKQFPEVSAAQITSVKTRDGSEGILSLDSMTAYFSNGYLIFAIAYNIGNKTVLDYSATFDMMIKSFKLL